MEEVHLLHLPAQRSTQRSRKMKKQGNMFQTKEQKTKTSEKEKVEISNLPNKEFKVMIIKMLNELEKN